MSNYGFPASTTTPYGSPYQSPGPYGLPADPPPRRRDPLWPRISGWLAVVGIAAVVLAIPFAIWLVPATHVQHPSHCTVTGKDRTSGSSSGAPGDMRVYTSCGTFTVGDSWLEGQFRSADLYGSLQPGHTYNFKTRGYRVGFPSMFPNIVKAEETH